METLESLSDLLETTGEIRSIVRTMKSLSAVSIRQYEQAEAALSGYERTVELGLTALLQDRAARGLPLPSTVGAGTGRAALIVIGSDRGLCGRYNGIVVRAAAERLGEDTAVLGVIGARAAARLAAAGRPPDRVFFLPGAVAGLASLVQSVIVEVDRWTRARGIGCVELLHNRRAGTASAVPTARSLLPIPDTDLRDLLGAGWPGRGRPFFRMDHDRLLSWLVRQRLFVVLYRALAEALASEHATRLAAMQRAERKIDERKDDLNALYRRKRQETITRELLDVVSGFEAVGGEGR
ncbi:F-type H+-transporting ATPase subunit gamma [Rhodovulum sp. ES.010]|uniref:F0F1 ATP synthase subunit gamma n=1 Tax=Rhodovulum sp. ES.010 TaxID=1882821 RepID=UPI0009270C06|nr:F0F1 ATP synthase subunit gamma [Rhodovulum sp. ES.010]SIO28374.1 F-type H+-transporting ATPase subunit gamma [Rhodovulum sp. ES.010]